MALRPAHLLLLVFLGCDDTKDGGISSGGESIDADAGNQDGGPGVGAEDAGGSGTGGDDGSASGGDSGSGSGGDSGSGSGGAPCETMVTTTLPEQEASDWFYLDPLEIEFNEYDPTTQISLSHSGASVPGSQQLDDDNERLIRFVPDAPLDPRTQYTLLIRMCSGASEHAVDFSTSELGTPLTCSLEGRTFRADLSSARFLHPPTAIAELLLDGWTTDFLLSAFGEGGGDLDLHAAVSAYPGGPQDHCEPSIELPSGRWTNPTFTLGPQDTRLTLAGAEVTVNNLFIRGTFAPDCSYTGGGRWEGELDMRTTGPFLGDLFGTSDPDELCGLFLTFGLECEACTTDGATYCLEFEVDQLTGTETEGSLTCVDEVDCHPLCAASTCDRPEAGECD